MAGLRPGQKLLLGGRRERQAIVGLNPRPTIVMIAHRDESLSFCDRILRLQNGRLAADEPALALTPARQTRHI